MKNFTFKKYIPTGMYSSFELDETEIKLNKMQVGSIVQIRESYDFKIRFAVKKEKTEEDPAPFKWIFFKTRFANENDARQFIKDNYEAIQRDFDLYYFED